MTDHIRPQAYIHPACETIRLASKTILQNIDRVDRITMLRNGQTNTTYFDIEERMIAIIKDELNEKFPQHGIMHTLPNAVDVDTEQDFIWHIGSLNGHQNFLSGIPFISLSLHLEYQKNTILTVVYNPLADEMFTSLADHSSRMNDKRIRIDQPRHPHAQELFAKEEDHTPTSILQKITRHMSVRSLGCPSLSICYTAANRHACYYAENIHKKAVAAALKIAIEAKVEVITQTSSSNLEYFSKLICIGPRKYQGLVTL